jgi:hypothetical protein
MAVTNAISSVIIVGALIASAAGALSSIPAKIVATNAAPVAVDNDITPTGIAIAKKAVVAPVALRPSSAGHSLSKWLGLIAVALASVNIFGGFAVTERMLAMYKKKERPAAAK